MKKVIVKESFDEQVWNRNTDLCMDVKTILRSDRVTMVGKSYPGVLTRDTDDHYTFTETVQACVEKRNPQVYRGKHITVTRKDDGTYSPNFRPVKVGAGFNVGRYAAGVANELLWALEGLVENGPVEEESK
jgi:hypothetical protein